MRNYKTTFADEEENTQHFMEKLQKFKTASKDLRKKNTFKQHQSEWRQEYTRQKELEYKYTYDLHALCNNLDAIYQTDFSELHQDLSIKNVDFTSNMFHQLQNVKNLISIQNPQEHQPLFQQMKQQFTLSIQNIKNQQENDINSMKNQNQVYLNQEKDLSRSNKENQNIFVKDDQQNENIENEDQQLSKNSDQIVEKLQYQILQKSQKKVNELSANQTQSEIEFLEFESIYDLLQSFNLKDEDDIDWSIKGDKDVEKQYNQVINMLKEMEELQLIKVGQDNDKLENQKFKQNIHLQEKFRHIYNTYIKRGKDREFYMERLKQVFPEMSKKDLEEQDAWVNQIQMDKKKKNAIKRDNLRQKLAIKLKSEQEITRIIQQRIENSKSEQEKLQLQMKLFNLQEEYDVRKELYLRKQLDEEVISNAEKQKREEFEKSQKIKAEKYYQHQKQAAIQYQDKKEIKKYNELLEEKVKFKLKLLREKEQQEKQRIVQINQPYVESRQQYEYYKIQEKIIQKEKNIQQKEYNKYRINNAIENYSIRPKVEKDFVRLQQTTESKKAKLTKDLDKADKVNMFQNKGFTVEQLYSDIRYRLGAALFDAGLQGNQYGHQILTAISKPPIN